MNLPDDLIRVELAKKTAKSIVDHGSIPMATLKESIRLHDKVNELLAKEIQFPEVQPFPEIPEVDFTCLEEKINEILEETKKKGLLEYDLQIDENTRKKLKGDKGDVGIPGKSGIDGRDGLDGTNGTNGIDGRVATPEEVVTKLESLKGNDRLSVKAIKGLDEIIQNVRETKIIGSGARTLAGLFDIGVTSPTNGQALVYNSTLQKWSNGTVSGSGITLQTNGVVNTSQTTLNLKQGTNVTLADDGLGGVTINAAGGGGGSGITRSVSSVAINTTGGAATVTDYLVFCSGVMTYTLPTAVGNTNRYTLVHTDTNTLTIGTTSAQTIAFYPASPATTATITRQGLVTELLSDGSNWWTI